MLTSIKAFIPKINFSLFALISILLPIYQKPIGLIIAVLSLLVIIEGIIYKNFSIRNKNIFFVGIAFFLIHVISVFYSDDQPKAWFDIEVKLSLLIFPLLFCVQNQYLKNNSQLLLNFFAFSTIVGSVVMLVIPYRAYMGQGFEFLNHVREMRYMHPSYFSMYVIFSISILIKLITDNKRKLGTYKYLAFIPMLLLTYLVFLLQSKAAIISIIIILLYLLILSIIKLRSFLLKIAISLLIISVTLVIVQKSSRLQSMFNSIEEINDSGDSSDSTTGVRYNIWMITLSEIKSNWAIGVGAGDIKSTLSKGYVKYELDGAEEHSLNVHNQFLETFLGQGILGIILLLALFYFGLIEAVKRKNWLLTVFLMLVTLSFTPESMLNSAAGVIFFAFFYYFLFLVTKEKESKKSNS